MFHFVLVAFSHDVFPAVHDKSFLDTSCYGAFVAAIRSFKLFDLSLNVSEPETPDQLLRCL